jgi:hypothetical protein
MMGLGAAQVLEGRGKVVAADVGISSIRNEESCPCINWSGGEGGDPAEARCAPPLLLYGETRFILDIGEAGFARWTLRAVFMPCGKNSSSPLPPTLSDILCFRLPVLPEEEAAMMVELNDSIVGGLPA